MRSNGSGAPLFDTAPSDTDMYCFHHACSPSLSLPLLLLLCCKTMVSRCCDCRSPVRDDDVDVDDVDDDDAGRNALAVSVVEDNNNAAPITAESRSRLTGFFMADILILMVFV